MTVVDSSPHILARDLLLLYLLLLTLDDPVPRADLVHAHKVMVDAVSYRLAQAVWSGWMSFANDPSALHKLQTVRSLKQSVRTVRDVLARYVKSCPRQHQRAVSDWLKRGSLNRTQTGNFPNVTLACFSPLRSEYLDRFEDVAPKWSEETEWLKGVDVVDEMVYAPHGMDIIFQDWDYNTVVRSVRQDVSLIDMYRIYLTQVFARARHQMLRSSKFSLTFIRAHVRDLTSHPTILRDKFDRIATGIQADLLGTPYILQHLGKLLNEDNICARLITHHRVWSLCLDWRKDQQAREACQKSKKTQRPPDPLLLMSGRWATFRHFLQAELLYHLHQQDSRPLHPDNAPVFHNVRRAYQMLLSDYTRHLNNIVPFRFQADKRTASMVDSRLHTLEWRRMTRSRIYSTTSVMTPTSTTTTTTTSSSTLQDNSDPASHYVDNLISFSHQSQSMSTTQHISARVKVEAPSKVIHRRHYKHEIHPSKPSLHSHSKSKNEQSTTSGDGNNILTKHISKQLSSSNEEPINQQADNYNPCSKDPHSYQYNIDNQTNNQPSVQRCEDEGASISQPTTTNLSSKASSVIPSTTTTTTTTTITTTTSTSSTRQHRPRSLYVSSHPKSPLLSPEFDFWERQDIVREKQKKATTARTYAEIPVGISRRIQKVFQSEPKKEKASQATKSAPVSPQLTRNTRVVKEKASVFERGVPERSTFPETRKKNLDMIPTTPVRKLISMFTRAFALRDNKDKDGMIRGRYRRSHSLHSSLFTDDDDGEQERGFFTNSLRISRGKNKSHKYREIDESGLCTFPRRARPHSVAVSKFYVDFSDEEEDKKTNSLEMSPDPSLEKCPNPFPKSPEPSLQKSLDPFPKYADPIPKSPDPFPKNPDPSLQKSADPSMTTTTNRTTTTTTTNLDPPRKKIDYDSPIRSLITSVTLGSPTRKRSSHNNNNNNNNNNSSSSSRSSPLRDTTITVKRDELRLVNLRPGSPRLPSPVSPSPAADNLPTMDWPEHTSTLSPHTRSRSSLVLSDVKTYHHHHPHHHHSPTDNSTRYQQHLTLPNLHSHSKRSYSPHSHSATRSPSPHSHSTRSFRPHSHPSTRSPSPHSHTTRSFSPHSHSATRSHSPRSQQKLEQLLSQKKSNPVDIPMQQQQQHQHQQHQQQQHQQQQQQHFPVDRSEAVRCLVSPVDHSEDVRCSLVPSSLPLKSGTNKKLIKVIPSQPQYQPPPLAARCALIEPLPLSECPHVEPLPLERCALLDTVAGKGTGEGVEINMIKSSFSDSETQGRKEETLAKETQRRKETELIMKSSFSDSETQGRKEETLAKETQIQETKLIMKSSFSDSETQGIFSPRPSPKLSPRGSGDKEINEVSVKFLPSTPEEHHPCVGLWKNLHNVYTKKQIRRYNPNNNNNNPQQQ
ncbi:hypothetical protein Pmani_013992 [Petrolisthes manimaculis]|uniref:DH domain-containing protein n=1 Tax=Petrolisthes manimaculis TaxID=1843537 RepID=A0AAE1PW88_9EUCA|nr:hypothetical protein Pmani_013992 [Petrolisthes manimaculis]